MPRFITRVELSEAGIAGEDALREAMEHRGFSRQIRVADRWYWLPGGEYLIVGEFDGGTVLRWAASAVAKLGGRARILVTESPAAVFCDGLDPV